MPNKFKYQIALYSLLFICLLLVALMLINIYPNYPIIFPIEDSYIYHTYGYFFSIGKFLTYSIGEPHSNGNTSFLYYLIISSVHCFGRILSQIFSYDVKETSLALTYIMHVFLYLLFVYLFVAKLVKKERIGTSSIILCLILFFNGPILYAFFSGLENPVTIVLIILLLIGIEYNHRKLELGALILLAINRPDTAIMVFLYSLTRFGLLSYKEKKQRMYLRYLLVITSAACIVPAINYLYTGRFLTASSTRIGADDYINLLFYIKLLLERISHSNHFLICLYVFVPWLNPTELDNPHNLMTVSLQFFLSIIYVYALLVFLYKCIKYSFNHLISANVSYFVKIIFSLILIFLLLIISSGLGHLIKNYFSVGLSGIVLYSLITTILFYAAMYYALKISFNNPERNNFFCYKDIDPLIVFLLVAIIILFLLNVFTKHFTPGEFARYYSFLFPLVTYLFIKYAGTMLKSKAIVYILLIVLIPAFNSTFNILDHFRRGTTFYNKLHYQTALQLRHSRSVNSIALWETGIMSYFLSNEKKVIDLYGLGTTRYSLLTHGFEEDKVEQILADKPDVIVTWQKDKNKCDFLESKLVNRVSSMKKLYSFNVDPSCYLFSLEYPKGMVVYELSYYK